MKVRMLATGREKIGVDKSKRIKTRDIPKNTIREVDDEAGRGMIARGTAAPIGALDSGAPAAGGAGGARIEELVSAIAQHPDAAAHAQAGGQAPDAKSLGLQASDDEIGEAWAEYVRRQTAPATQ